MLFLLSQKSKEKLIGVHPDLICVVNKALTLTPFDFCVLEGLRTKERQEELLKEKKTTTLKSRHLTGHAVDIGAMPSGQLRWAWEYYEQLGVIMKKAAFLEGINIEWGGDWVTFKDGVHFQLPWDIYPA